MIDKYQVVHPVFRGEPPNVYKILNDSERSPKELSANKFPGVHSEKRLVTSYYDESR